MLDLTCLCQMQLEKSLVYNLKYLGKSDKHTALATHDLNIGQHVMYQDSTTKHWYPAVIASLCSEPRSYKIITGDGIVYRKTQSHLKFFSPQNKMS